MHMTALKAWMEAHDRDDASVAEAVTKISRSQVNRLKNGKSQPSWRVAVALERITGIPAGELFNPAQDAAA